MIPPPNKFSLPLFLPLTEKFGKDQIERERKGKEKKALEGRDKQEMMKEEKEKERKREGEEERDQEGHQEEEGRKKGTEGMAQNGKRLHKKKGRGEGGREDQNRERR